MRTCCLAMLISSIVLVACADSHKLTRTSGPASMVQLQRQASVYVGVPLDGRFESIVYSGSGATTAQIVATAFAPYVEKVTTGNKVEDFDQALATARTGEFTYLLYPQILHWEDRATEWSSRPDLVTVKLSVTAVETGEILDSAMIDGKSGLATLGGDRPQDLLPKPIGEFAASLFK